MAPFEAIYGRRFRSPVGWFEFVESSTLGPKIIFDALEKVCVIRDRLKITYCRQNSYADNRRRELEFEVGDMMYMNVSPMKGVMTFDKIGKLSVQYAGPYEVFQRVAKVRYKLTLPNELSSVDPVFHISILKKCIVILCPYFLLKGLVWMRTSLMKRFRWRFSISKLRSWRTRSDLRKVL